jgi:hypothetical protein
VVSKDKKTGSRPVKSREESQLKGLVDDTPKSFARLMQFHTLGKRLPNGLDNGNTQPKKNNKKRKLDTVDSPGTVTAIPEPSQQPQPIPKILPGERLSDFAARVDQALPIAGLHTTDKQRASKVPGLKERTTKHNKRLERMQNEWRETERRRKEKLEEEMDELEDEREEQDFLWNGVGSKATKKNRKQKKSRGGGPGADDDEDPWKVLEKSRAEAKQRNLQDVVQAPPQLKKIKSKLKEVGGGVGVDVGNVPGSVGSLRKREEMGEARRKVIEGYRKRVGRGVEIV